MSKFKPGDKVVATGNYEDEQQGCAAPRFPQKVLKVMNTTEAGTSGQWIQTDLTTDWVDAAWFRLVMVNRGL